MTSTPAPAPQKTEKGTKYVILVENKQTKDWNVAGFSTASSTNAAVLKHVKESGTALDGFRVAAIPQRSWNPTKVTVETTKTVRLG